MKLIYKKTEFDHFDISDSGTIYIRVCEKCNAKAKGKYTKGIEPDDGCGACSVKGCSIVGDDDDIEIHIIDLSPDGSAIIHNTEEVEQYCDENDKDYVPLHKGYFKT